MGNKAKQENNVIWDIKIDTERMVIIYDHKNNYLGGYDYNISEVTENMSKIASKLNLPVENEFGGIKFQVAPGMTAEDGYKVWNDALNIHSQKQSEKRKFMEEHKQRLTDSKTIHNEVLLGVMKADLPQHEQIGEKNDEALFVVSSHIFQEKLAESPEFSDILRDVKKAAKISRLKLEVDKNNKKDVFANVFEILEYDRIAEESGTDYNSVDHKTLQAISYEYYRRHKDNLENLLGQEGVRMLNRIEENKALFFGRFSEEIYKEDRIKSSLPGGKDLKFYFSSEFCTARLKEGDKILLTENTIEDPEFGKLSKYDGFIYEGNNKYKHFYQQYVPSGRDYVADDSIKITRAMQQKTQSSLKSNEIER